MSRIVFCLLLATLSLTIPGGPLTGGSRKDSVSTPGASAPAEKPRFDALGDPLPAGAHTRLGTLRFFQGAAVDTLAFSRDGRILYSAAASTPLHAWDVATGKEIPSPDQPAGKLTTAAVSADARILAVLHEDGNLRLWSLETGKLLRQKSLGLVSSRPMTFTGDGKALVWVDEGNTLRLHDLTANKDTPLSKPSGPESPFQLLTASPNGRLLAALGGTQRQLVLVWDLKTGKRIRRYPEDEGQLPIQSLVFSPDSRSLLAGFGQGLGGQGQVRVWDVDSVEETAHVEIGTQLSALAVAADGKLFAAGGYDGEIKLFHLSSGKLAKKLAGNAMPPSVLAFSPDGKTLAVGYGDGRISTWDLVRDTQLSPRAAFTFSSARFRTDGRTVVGVAAKQVLHFSTETGKQLREFEVGDGLHTLSSDGRFLAAVSGEGQLRLFDLDRPAVPRDLSTKLDNGGVIAFSPNGRWLASVSFTEPNVTHVWDVATGKLWQSLKFEARTMEQLALYFSGDSRVLFTGHPTSRHLHRWELATGQRRAALRLPGAASGQHPHHWEQWVMIRRAMMMRRAVIGGGAVMPEVALMNNEVLPASSSPNGQLLAIHQQDRVALCSVAPVDGGLAPRRGNVVRYLEGAGDHITCSEFSPSGDLLAAGVTDNTAMLWDVRTGEVRARLEGHRGAVQVTTFSSDGKLLLTASNDGTALVWDIETVLRLARSRPRIVAPVSRPFAELWDDLAASADRAEIAIRQMVATPDTTVRLLARQVRPVPAVEPGRLARLIAELDSDNRTVRELASKQMLGFGELAETALRKAATTGSAEVKRQVNRLLEQIERPTRTGEEARLLRAIEVLELIGTPAARNLLAELSRGAAEARLTREAAEALRRLTRRVSSEP